MSSRSILHRRCLYRYGRRQRPAFLLSPTWGQAYSTLTSTGISKRKWRDVAISFITGFAIITAYKSYTGGSHNDGLLNPTTFSEYVLVEKQPASRTSSIFTLSPTMQPADFIYQRAWQEGIWSVEFKQPQLQIARAYTPLPPTLRPIAEDEEDLRFIIRKDPEGEVSSYLHQLPEGASIDVRGPNIEYRIPSDAKKVLFLAGGTGIAPALQAAYCLLEVREKSEETRICILWASRRREDCSGGASDHLSEVQSQWWTWLSKWNGRPEPANTAREEKRVSYIVKELEALKAKHPGQVTVEYFVDEEESFITEQVVRGSIAGLDQKPQVMLSGPDGFIKYLAGPKTWSNGREAQGPLGGVLHRLGLSSREVWKL